MTKPLRPCTNRPSSSPGQPVPIRRQRARRQLARMRGTRRPARLLGLPQPSPQRFRVTRPGYQCRNRRQELRPCSRSWRSARGPDRFSTPSGHCRRARSSTRSATRNDSTDPSRLQKSGDPPARRLSPSLIFLTGPGPVQSRMGRWCGPGHPPQVRRHRLQRRQPLVFAGSSNLAAGGEEQNGDNLVCFADRGIAATYAIEAIQLVDHYRPGRHAEGHRRPNRIQLQSRSANWALKLLHPGQSQVPRTHPF